MIMTTEEKELLLKDLCARLPYHCQVFKVYVDDLDETHGYSLTLDTWCVDEFNADKAVVKPYLRPMSSMTEEEKKRYDDILTKMYYHEKSTLGDISDYLNSIHVDYRGLIPKGLAIEVNEDNNHY